jgi:hypothetical protein
MTFDRFNWTRPVAVMIVVLAILLMYLSGIVVVHQAFIMVVVFFVLLELELIRKEIRDFNQRFKFYDEKQNGSDQEGE